MFCRHCSGDSDGDFLGEKKALLLNCNNATQKTLMFLTVFPGTLKLGVLEIGVWELENTNFIYSGATGKRECVSMEMGLFPFPQFKAFPQVLFHSGHPNVLVRGIFWILISAVGWAPGRTMKRS